MQTILYASDHARQFDDVSLCILHVNLRHKGGGVNRVDLRQAVEQEVGPLANANYQVRTDFLLEKAILDEAQHQNADYVIIGKSRQTRWLDWLATHLGIGLDLKTVLSRHLATKLVVVKDRETAALVNQPEAA